VLAPEEGHYRFVAARMLSGRVIPFLGAGANLVERSADSWKPGVSLPSGRELAVFLTDYLSKMWTPLDETPDLARISQYIEAKLGQDVLYEELRELFVAAYEPNALHRLLARLSSVLRTDGGRQQLIITTNYDSLIEAAFIGRDEPYDVVWYEAKARSEHRGRFIHRPYQEAPHVIAEPNSYADISEERPVILKIHGAADPDDASADSYVITEDDYLSYLTRSDISNELPATLKARLADSNFLFLGYSLSDWNLRVVLNRIWGERQFASKSWAIQRYEQEREKMYEIERKLWDDRGEVEPYYLELSEYVEKLGALIPEPATADAVSA
jgi:hypothetical protein